LVGMHQQPPDRVRRERIAHLSALSSAELNSYCDKILSGASISRSCPEGIKSGETSKAPKHETRVTASRRRAAARTTVAQRSRTTTRPTRSGSVASLSPRELQVLRAAADGLSRRAVGEHLFISEGTVANHLYRIYAKLGVHNRMAAVAMVFGLGPVEAAPAIDEIADG
jgi:DNA-binding NarL/FixJ family response regulator